MTTLIRTDRSHTPLVALHDGTETEWTRYAEGFDKRGGVLGQTWILAADWFVRRTWGDEKGADIVDLGRQWFRLYGTRKGSELVFAAVPGDRRDKWKFRFVGTVERPQ